MGSEAVAGVTVRGGPRVRPPVRGAPLLRGRWAVPAAVAAGLALVGSFPPYDAWWLAPVGVAGLALAAHRQRVRVGAALGGLAGLVFFATVLSWTNLHTGWLPWLLLSGLQAGYLALLGAAAAYVGPLVDRWPAGWAPVTAVLWVTQEALRDRTPFGGFPWARLAFSQGDSPALRWAAVGGAPLVTAVVALAGGLLAVALAAALGGPADRNPGAAGRRRWARVAAPAVAAAAALGGGLAVPVAAPAGRSVTVAIVQGNVPRMGLDFNAQRRAVLDNHVRGTLELAAAVAQGRVARPDLVVWPENASDIDPLRHPDAAARIDEAAAAVRVPILLGAVLRGPGPGQVRNAGLLWLPGGGADLGQLYVKRHPVPFAEYVPMRRIARWVSTDVNRVRSDFVAGSAPGVVRTAGTVLGDVICFEVAYDEVVRDTVTAGARLLVVQTNNATFDAAEARQQLAMVRLRAVEHGRDALMASTVGVSGFVTADGAVHDATAFNEAAVVVRTLREGSARTLATRVGYWPEAALAALAAAALVAAAWRRRPVAGRRQAGQDGDESVPAAPAGRAVGAEVREVDGARAG